jgi:hypothetical protein
VLFRSILYNHCTKARGGDAVGVGSSLVSQGVLVQLEDPNA